MNGTSKQNLSIVADPDYIIRGKIYRTAFPYLEQMSLKFFEQCDECVNCYHSRDGQNFCGRVTAKIDGFEKVEGQNENEEEKEFHVVIRFKARHAIVLSTKEMNEKQWPNVIVAPIVGIHPDDLGKNRIKRIMKRDPAVFNAYYLEPSVTGDHAYIDLAKIRPVPKNWLLQEIMMFSDREAFDEISIRIGLLLAQKRLAECRGCKRPCENCEARELGTRRA